MDPTNNTQKLAAASEKLLVRSTKPLTRGQIYEAIGIEVEEPNLEMRIAMKLLVSMKRVKTVHPPWSKEQHFQHVIDKEDYDWGEIPKQEEVDPCPPTPVCHIADNHNGRCEGCPVFHKKVDNWKDVPMWYAQPDNYCPTGCSNPPQELDRVGTTGIWMCPICGWDNQPKEEEE